MEKPRTERNLPDEKLVTVTVAEKRLLSKIKRTIEKGNDAEVREAKDGTLKVYAVQKHVVN